MKFVTTPRFGMVPNGGLLLAAPLDFPLWKGVIHTRSLLIDMGGADAVRVVGGAMYSAELVRSGMGVATVVAL